MSHRSLRRIDTLHSNNMISEKEQDETRTTARLAQVDYDIPAAIACEVIFPGVS